MKATGIRAVGNRVFVRHLKEKLSNGAIYLPPSSIQQRKDMGINAVSGHISTMAYVLSVGEKVTEVKAGQYVVLNPNAAGTGGFVEEEYEFLCAFYEEGDLEGVLEEFEE
jgi:Zn-dependent alcohol dehydrogenase